MLRKQDSKSGATLVFALDMKSHESSDELEYRYTIKVNGKVKFNNLTENEYFDRMEDYAVEFYQTGSPAPKDIKTIIERI